MSNQPQLFETEDQYGNDIIQGPKIKTQKLKVRDVIIDPKNPHTVGKSFMNLGNHTLIAGFIAIVSWVVWISYV